MKTMNAKYCWNTWLAPEEACSDYGTFTRKGQVRHATKNELVAVRADIADTFFSIPATTKDEYGFLMMGDNGEFVFHPLSPQLTTPAQYRAEVKRSYSKRRHKPYSKNRAKCG